MSSYSADGNNSIGADDSARIAALQVGFVALLELIGREKEDVYYRVIECLRQTGEMPDNADFRDGFSELAEMIESVAYRKSSTDNTDIADRK